MTDRMKAKGTAIGGYTPWGSTPAPNFHLSVDVSWMPDGLCTQSDPDEWYPDKGGSTYQAKQICRRCPVRQQCLDYALTTQQGHGVWGGYSERERRRLRSGETIAPVIRKPGQDLPKRRNEIRDERAELYRQGLTYRQMADTLGVSYDTIRQWASANGLRPNRAAS